MEFPYLKAYMRDGTAYRLERWTVNEADRTVTGTGTHYNANRRVVGEGQYTIAVDDAAIFQTNVATASPALAPLLVFAGVSAAITVACLSNPKACFGSCPTFYMEDTTGRLVAEGFSSSIAPNLEDDDLDDVGLTAEAGSTVRIVMRNEALETHVVRHANLVAAPAGAGSVRKDTDGNLWRVRAPRAPARCAGAPADKLAARDGDEYSSPADSTDLGARETLELVFAAGDVSTPGLLITARQTLLPTFLLYHALASMGGDVGYWLARTRHPARNEDNPVVSALGWIDVEVERDGRWQTVGRAGEHGPLASDTWVAPLTAGANPDSVRLRLRMTRGAWRIDRVALVDVAERVTAVRIEPEVVTRDGTRDDDALYLLLSNDDVLCAMPGDACTLSYALPCDAERYHLFLDTRGYYLEWMREEWESDESEESVMQLIFNMPQALRDLAPRFKEIEADMESSFWASRYAKPE